MTKIEIEGDSEEAVALALLRMIAEAEGYVSDSGMLQGVAKEWVLDTYAECLLATYGERDVLVEADEEEEEEGDDEEDEEDEEDQRNA